MKNIEKRRINLVKTSNGERGSLWLKKLAIQPFFSKEQCKMIEFKEEAFRREKNDNNFELKAEVTYEERMFDVPRTSFDSVNGIQESL